MTRPWTPTDRATRKEPMMLCPTCHHAFTPRGYARHQHVKHEVQCPFCPAILPPAGPRVNSANLTIRSHMQTVHGIKLQQWQAQQRREARVPAPPRPRGRPRTATPQPKAQPKPRPLAAAPQPKPRPAPRSRPVKPRLTPLERQRNHLAGIIRSMREGPNKQAARRRFIGLAYRAWVERQGCCE